jgi:hypothetical protein
VDVLTGGGAAAAGGKQRFWVQITFAGAGQLMERIVTFPIVIWGNQEYLGH